MIIPDINLGAEYVNKLRAQVESFVDAHPELDPDYIPSLIERDSKWLEFAKHPTVLGCVADLIGEDIGILREIYAQPAFRPLWDKEILPGDQAPLEFARNHGDTESTCRMGSDAKAVVDPTLRVNGIEGLRVADASVMPLVISANTNATSIMIGERSAGLIFRNQEA